MRLPLSLVVITLNEEPNIARCIKSVPFASEVIVIDSLSTDRTAEIAAGLGAQIISRKFNGYRDQKQFALNQATQPWILSLDADEALSPMLQDEIESLMMTDQRQPSDLGNIADGYRMPRLSFHLGKWIRHGGWYPDYQIRLFRRGRAEWVGGEVHEHVRVVGNLGTLKNDLHHYVFRDLDDQIDTNNEFSTLGANQLLRQGLKFSLLKMVFKPLGKFLECYVWKRGFLDGPEGFIIALGAAQSLFLKYAKLWEAQVVSADNIYKSKRLGGKSVSQGSQGQEVKASETKAQSEADKAMVERTKAPLRTSGRPEDLSL